MSSDTQTPPEAPGLDRKTIRASIFSGKHKPRGIIVDFFGTQIEIRQLRVADMAQLALGMQNEQEAVIATLVHMAYVPGTEERVFDDADADSLKQLPNGPDMTRVAQALKELVDVNLPDAKES